MMTFFLCVAVALVSFGLGSAYGHLKLMAKLNVLVKEYEEIQRWWADDRKLWNEDQL